MKTVICLNGEKLNNYQFDKKDFYIACDGGLNYLKENDIAPNVILGDFDSLGYVPDNSITFSAAKDFTDGELGLLEAKKLNFDVVEFICAGGKRDDQFFANVGLLEKADKLGIKASIVTNAGKIYFVNNAIELNVPINSIISLYPLENTLVKSSLGLKYVYSNTSLCRGDTLGISNVATSEQVKIQIEHGAVLVFVNN